MSTFDAISRLRPYQVWDGIVARAINGDRITLAVVELEPDAVLPEHHHEQEQMGFVISGTITMRIASEKRELNAGDTYTIPSHVPHEAAVGSEGCIVVDVFSPTRGDWEKLNRLDPSPGRWP